MEYFKNAHDALMFALRFSTQQYAESPMSKMMKRAGAQVGTGKGLVALDGAATAGMIQARIERLNELQRACIIARFTDRTIECKCCGGHRMAADYKKALETLAEWARPLVSAEVDTQRMRFGVVQSFYDRRASITQLARTIGMPPRTVLNQKTKVWAALSPLDKDALAAAEDVLHDLCGEIE